MNVFDKKIFFKREGLRHWHLGCEERYHECVGQRRCSIQEAKLKVMGLEIVRSSTPLSSEGMVERGSQSVSQSRRKDLQNYVEETWQKFKELHQRTLFLVGATTLIDMFPVRQFIPRELRCTLEV